MSIFLDYSSEYYAGLCNQLYLITNHINDAEILKKNIYIKYFISDIFSKSIVNFDEVVNIPATNKNFEKLGLFTKILEECPEDCVSAKKLCIYPVTNVKILKSLVFSDSFVDYNDKLKGEYYSIHFRLDMDCVISKLFGNESLLLLLNNKLLISNDMDVMIDRYSELLLIEYLKYVNIIGFDKKYYICTPIGKWPVHSRFEKYLLRIVKFIEKNGGTVIIPEKYYPQRELNALVELLIITKSQRFIGFYGSTFSEGYAYIVSGNENSFFVNGE